MTARFERGWTSQHDDRFSATLGRLWNKDQEVQGKVKLTRCHCWRRLYCSDRPIDHPATPTSELSIWLILVPQSQSSPALRSDSPSRSTPPGAEAGVAIRGPKQKHGIYDTYGRALHKANHIPIMSHYSPSMEHERLRTLVHWLVARSAQEVGFFS